MTKAFLDELEEIAAETATAVAGTYLSKVTGQAPGTPPLTGANIGRIAGVVATSVVFQHLQAFVASQQAAAALKEAQDNVAAAGLPASAIDPAKGN